MEPAASSRLRREGRSSCRAPGRYSLDSTSSADPAGRGRIRQTAERNLLNDLGAIGDFLGGIGVVVTLVYLAVQIRKNTQSVRSAALDSISTSICEFMDKTAQDPALTKIWFEGLSGTVELSEVDTQRFQLLLLSLARRWENAFHQSRAGVLESASWSGMRQGLAFVFSSPGAQSLWNAPAPHTGRAPMRAIFSADFAAFVERALASGIDRRQSAV